MDCDGTLDGRDLPRIAQPVTDDQADLVLGRRVATTRDSWPGHARVANHVLTWALRRSTQCTLRDLGPMRAARRHALLALDLTDRRSGWPLEMVVRAVEVGWRIHEVDVAYGPRTGRSKVTGTFRGTVGAVADMARVARTVRAGATP
jgi:hypothetical protein